MIDDDLAGPRIGELFLAEIVGRGTEGLDTFTVEGLDDPVAFSCECGQQYTITRNGTTIADVTITAETIEIGVVDEGTITVESGGEIQPAVDKLRRRTDPQ